MNGEELEETEVPGFQADVQTIYCSNVINNQFIQVNFFITYFDKIIDYFKKY